MMSFPIRVSFCQQFGPDEKDRKAVKQSSLGKMENM